jgi:hypothetical protein
MCFMHVIHGTKMTSPPTASRAVAEQGAAEHRLAADAVGEVAEELPGPETAVFGG